MVVGDDRIIPQHGIRDDALVSNERTYYDPAKGDEKHECGLHAKLVTDKA